MTAPSRRTITWMLVSRIAALVIVFSLLVAFLAASVAGRTLDSGVVVAFLGIASGLLFGPAVAYGLQQKRNGKSDSDSSS